MTTTAETLGVQERLALLDILPAQGNAKTMRAVRSLTAKLHFSDEERSALGLVTDGPKVSWSAAEEEARAFEIADAERAVIVARLSDLDTQGTLTVQMLPLFERFVGGD